MSSEKNTAWLSPEILDWHCSLYEASGTETDWNRPYETWSHGEEILNRPTSNLYLVDAITTLKRVVNQRLTQLNQLYCFDQIPVAEKPKRLLEQLAFWEIVRPSMLKQLIDIRNAIEHEDAPPPTQDRCFEFLDFVWYFLRSTDGLTRMMTKILEFSHGELHYEITSSVDPNSKWKIGLSGSVSPSMLSFREISGWIPLQVQSMETIEQFLAIIPKRDKSLASFLRGKYKDLQPNDLIVNANLLGQEEHIEKIIRLYFSAS